MGTTENINQFLTNKMVKNTNVYVVFGLKAEKISTVTTKVFKLHLLTDFPYFEVTYFVVVVAVSLLFYFRL